MLSHCTRQAVGQDDVPGSAKTFFSSRAMMAGRGLWLVVLSCPFVAFGQAGIGVQQDLTPTGKIGSNKDQSGATLCPAGTLLTGMRHVDKSMLATGSSVAQSMTRGMTVQIDLYCSHIVVSGSTVSLQQSTVAGVPAVSGADWYSHPGFVDTRYCPAGMAVQRMGGSDRRTSDSSYDVPWTSSMTLVCKPIALDVNGWARFNGTSTSIQVGNKETNAVHTERGPFCPDVGTSTTVGYYLQGGGEGYDGVNIYCGSMRQARHSAVLEFTDFAWSQQRGASGWLVTLMHANADLVVDSVRTPHASVAANDTSKLQSVHETFVIPGGNYKARLSQLPANVKANTFHTSGTCVTGIALGNEQDASCMLMVTGLPDLGVSVSGPSNTYNAASMVQSITMTAANLGPGATDGDDGFSLRMSLPSGWAVGGVLPANCAVDARQVTCALDPTPLGAASAPGGEGGSQSFAIPIKPDGLTAATSGQPVAVTLVRSVPDGDSDPTNNDYNTTNDVASTTVRFVPTPRIILSKITEAEAGGPFVFTLQNATPGTASVSTVSAGTAVMVGTDGFVIGDTGQPVTITETALPQGWRLASAVCTTGAGAPVELTPAGNSITVPATLMSAEGAQVACTLTNRRSRSALHLTKTSSPAGPWINGQSVTYTLTASNGGPDDAGGSVLRDPATTGLDCASFTCSATGGAQCPAASGSAAVVQDAGLVISTFPANSQVTVKLGCTVTASGF